MIRIRAEKVARVARSVPEAQVTGDDDADLLILGWGSTYGAITSAVQRARAGGHKVAQLHLRHLNPFPSNLGEILERHDKVLIPEINLGQLATLIKTTFLKPVIQLNRVQGLPFRTGDILKKILEITEAD